MATEDPTPMPVVEPAPEPAVAENADENPAATAKAGKSKKTKEPKAKRPAAPRKPPAHPPYEEVILASIHCFRSCICIHWLLIRVVLYYVVVLDD